MENETIAKAAEAASADMTAKSAPERRFYDREYATEWRKERDWLAERGFFPTYVKRLETGIERYKYRKSASLFENLSVFYEIEEAARDWKRIQRGIEERGIPLKAGSDTDFMAAIASLSDEEDDTI